MRHASPPAQDGRRHAIGLAAAMGTAVPGVWFAPAVLAARRARLAMAPRLAGVGDPTGVAITFDDGPDPQSTPTVLAALDRLGWRATFFMLGRMAAAAPGLAHEVAAAGHEVALHGHDHRSLLLRGPGGARDDLRRGYQVLAELVGGPRWWRPPYGLISLPALAAARQLEMAPVLWSAWGRDWRRRATPSSVAADVLGGLAPGGTVLLHDSSCTSWPGSWRATVAALPLLAEQLDRVGLTVRPLVEHLAAR